MRVAFPIRTSGDLERAIALVDELWGAAPGSADADLLEVMATLIDRYEADRSALPPGDPIELIAFKLEELGWAQRELARRLGWGSGRVSEVLGRKRPLTLAMVRDLSRVLGLPAGLLVHDHRDEEGVGWFAVPDDVGRRITTEAIQRGVPAQAVVAGVLDRAFGTNLVTFRQGSPSSDGRSAGLVVGHKAAA